MALALELCVEDQFLSEEVEWHLPRRTSLSSWYAPPQLVASAADVEITVELFESLRASWHREYGMSSSFTQITSCPSYRKLVNFGDKILPLIVRDLERRPEPDYWFDALAEITKQNPVSEKDRGYSRRMAKAWLSWWRVNKQRYA